jgi:uracil-DNA glycosylase family 4
MTATSFSIDCRLCPRLATFLDGVKQDHPDYHARPVAPFGEDPTRFLIVGLAPGMHGANATGRPFTGDFAGILLYQTLHKFGFATAPESLHRDDGLRLVGCRITNAVKCLPPQNKPETSEIRTCNQFLAQELEALPDNAVVLALGTIAHKAVVIASGCKQSAYKFAHNQFHELPKGIRLIDSYHCSRYNTQTKRLTAAMFEDVFAGIRSRLDGPSK